MSIYFLGNESYTITEEKNKWKIKKNDNKLSVVFEIPKSLCESEADLKDYLKANNFKKRGI